MDAHDALWIVRALTRPFRVKRACRRIMSSNSDSTTVLRVLQVLRESVEIVKQTTNPGTLFSRYNTALNMTEHIMESSFVEEHIRYAEEINAWLLTETDSIAVNFVNRCRAKGNLWFVQDEIFGDDTIFSEEVKTYLSDVLAQIRQEEPCAENRYYRYCSVIFTEHGKSYYYKTDDSSLACGDEVVVPVGCSGKQSVGIITAIDLFAAEDAPLPPSVTKDILCRHETT